VAFCDIGFVYKCHDLLSYVLQPEVWSSKHPIIADATDCLLSGVLNYIVNDDDGESFIII